MLWKTFNEVTQDAKKDLLEKTLKEKVLMPSTKRFRLKASVPKAVRNISKCSQS